MAKTAQDLVTRVLQKLTLLTPGDDPSADDDAFITGAWRTINDNLRAPTIKISTWTYDAIPEVVFEPLAEYVKEYLWQEYKGARENNALIVKAALAELRQATALAYTGSVLAVDHY